MSSTTNQETTNSDTERSEDKKEEEEAEKDCEECPVTRFMNKGGCKDFFIEVDNCAVGEDYGEKCRDARLKLKTCMFANPNHYGPYLAMEKAMLTQSLKELETAEAAAAAAAKTTAEAAAAAAKTTEEEEETKGN